MSQSEDAGKIDFAISIIDKLMDDLQRRKQDLLSVKADISTETYPNSFSFKTPLDSDKGLWGFLHDKILEPHKKKDGLGYIFTEKAGRIEQIRWGKTTDEHTREITNAAEWCLKKAEERATAR